MTSTTTDLKWRTVVACGMVAFAAAWNVSNVGTLADPLAEAYGVSLTTISFLTVALVGAQTIATFPVGAAVDRFGAYAVVASAVVLMSVGNLAALALPEPPVAMTARVIVGIGCAAAWVGGSELARAANSSALAQGLFGGIGLAGAGLVLAVLPALDQHLRWRTPYVTALAIALVAGAALGSVRAVAQTVIGTQHWKPPRREIFADRRLHKIALLMAMGVGLTIVLGNWVVPFLSRAGYSDVTAGAVGSLILLGGVASRPIGGWLMFRYGQWTRGMLCAALIAGALGTAIVTTTPPPALAAIATAVIGVAGGLVFAPSFAASARARPGEPGASLGVVGASSLVFVVIGTPMLAVTFSMPGQGRVGFAIACLLWLVPLLAFPTNADLGLRESAQNLSPRAGRAEPEALAADRR
jgi:MFS family permease